MWSLGALLELDDRAKMEAFLKVRGSLICLLSSEHVLMYYVFALVGHQEAVLDFISMFSRLKGRNSSLDLPHTQDDETIFEFTVNEQGQWEHWSNKVCGHETSPTCSCV